MGKVSVTATISESLRSRQVADEAVWASPLRSDCPIRAYPSAGGKLLVVLISPTPYAHISGAEEQFLGLIAEDIEAYSNLLVPVTSNMLASSDPLLASLNLSDDDPSFR